MNKEIEKLVIKIIIENREQANGALDSEEIYNKINNSPANIPDNSLKEIFENLEKKGFIKTVKYHNREGIIKHGAITITWISPFL